jgi:hypothetical protein
LKLQFARANLLKTLQNFDELFHGQAGLADDAFQGFGRQFFVVDGNC